jgi:hypothetical protein
MKLKKYFDKSDKLSSFLIFAHKKGIKHIHVSDEYSSYHLIKKSLEKIYLKNLTIIIKLSEPKKDFQKFNLKRFEKKLFKYRKDFGMRNTYIIQFVNRYKCKDKNSYLFHEKKIFDSLKDVIVKLKEKKIIKYFYYFPYYKNRNFKNKYKFIDGITIYRNILQKNDDYFAKKNNFKIISMRVFGGNNVINKNKKKLVIFNLKNKLVKYVIIGANNYNQLNEIL